MAMVEFREEMVDNEPVRGFLHRAASGDSDGIVLTHGAGANSNTMLLTSLAEGFCERGLSVLRCDLPFRQIRPTGPPSRGSAERDQKGLLAAATFLRREAKGRIFLGGHSYGGRQASILAASRAGAAEALLLLSYPLHPPLKPEQMRTSHFSSLLTPALFVSGERDGFGTKAELEAALGAIPARTRLITVPGAGHELMTARNRGPLTEDVVQAFLLFAQIG